MTFQQVKNLLPTCYALAYTDIPYVPDIKRNQISLTVTNLSAIPTAWIPLVFVERYIYNSLQLSTNELNDIKDFMLQNIAAKILKYGVPPCLSCK